jgi:hypothetical protein
MKPRVVRVFAIALVLGWAAPDLRQPNFGISAEARAKTHTQKKVKKRYQTAQKRAMQKRASNKAVIMPSPPPVRLAMADQQLPSSSPPASLDLPALPISPTMTSPPPERQIPTPDEHMEELRSGLEKLARTYPSPEAHMEALRLGLERLAKTMNGGSS